MTAFIAISFMSSVRDLEFELIFKRPSQICTYSIDSLVLVSVLYTMQKPVYTVTGVRKTQGEKHSGEKAFETQDKMWQNICMLQSDVCVKLTCTDINICITILSNIFYVQSPWVEILVHGQLLG